MEPGNWGGEGGLLVSQIPEGISLTCPLIQWPLRLVDVILAAESPSSLMPCSHPTVLCAEDHSGEKYSNAGRYKP